MTQVSQNVCQFFVPYSNKQFLDSDNSSSVDSFLINNKWMLDDFGDCKIRVVDRYKQVNRGQARNYRLGTIESAHGFSDWE